MAREQFEGTLIHTQARPDGPAGQPMTQALFQTTDDGTQAVAVWHNSQPPDNLEPGKTYAVTGDYVNHKERHFFFRPVVEALEAMEEAVTESQVPERVRHLLFRPRDWRRAHKIIASVSLGLTILLAGLVISYASGSTNERPQPASQQTSATTTDEPDQAGTVAATSQPAAEATPTTTATAATDCVSRVVPYQSNTRTDATMAKDTRRTVTRGVTGTVQVCYPNGRNKPAVETITRQKTDEVIAVGTKQSTPTQSTDGNSNSQPPAATTPTNPPPETPKPTDTESKPPEEGSGTGNGTTNNQISNPSNTSNTSN